MEFFDGAVGCCCSNFSSKFAKRCISKFFFHCWHFHLAAQKNSSSFYFQETCFIAHFLSLIKKTRVDDGFYSFFLLQSPQEIHSINFTRCIPKFWTPSTSNLFLTLNFTGIHTWIPGILISILFTYEPPWVCACSKLSRNIIEHTHSQSRLMALNFVSVASVAFLAVLFGQ